MNAKLPKTNTERSLADLVNKKLAPQAPPSLDDLWTKPDGRLTGLAALVPRVNPTKRLDTPSLLDLLATPKIAKTAERVKINVPSQLGQLIKLSRNSKNFTQQQLADLAGVGRRFIVECEAGKPRLEFAKVLQVASAVGIDIFAIKR